MVIDEMGSPDMAVRDGVFVSFWVLFSPQRGKNRDIVVIVQLLSPVSANLTLSNKPEDGRDFDDGHGWKYLVGVIPFGGDLIHQPLNRASRD
jgi:hypothetical protein